MKTQIENWLGIELDFDNQNYLGIQLNSKEASIDEKPNDDGKLPVIIKFWISVHKLLYLIHRRPVNVMSIGSMVAYLVKKYRND